MKKARELLTRLFCLPAVPTLAIAVPSMALCFAVLGLGIQGAAAYLAYGLSAYALGLLVTLAVRIARRPRVPLAESPAAIKLRSHPLGKKYLDDPAFRARVALYGSTAANCGYAVLKLAFGLYYRSAWFANLALYYLFLAAMRFSLVRWLQRNPDGGDYRGQLRKYRFCGWMLAGMNAALCAIVTMVVVQNNGFHYPGYLIYGMAAYAFYAVISSAIRLVKSRGSGSPVLLAAKNISMTTALVSMLALETGMLSQFGGGPLFRRSMTAASGFAVCVFELGMAVHMICKANRDLRKL